MADDPLLYSILHYDATASHLVRAVIDNAQRSKTRFEEAEARTAGAQRDCQTALQQLKTLQERYESGGMELQQLQQQHRELQELHAKCGPQLEHAQQQMQKQEQRHSQQVLELRQQAQQQAVEWEQASTQKVQETEQQMQQQMQQQDAAHAQKVQELQVREAEQHAAAKEEAWQLLVTRNKTAQEKLQTLQQRAKELEAQIAQKVQELQVAKELEAQSAQEVREMRGKLETSKQLIRKKADENRKQKTTLVSTEELLRVADEQIQKQNAELQQYQQMAETSVAMQGRIDALQADHDQKGRELQEMQQGVKTWIVDMYGIWMQDQVNIQEMTVGDALTTLATSFHSAIREPIEGIALTVGQTGESTNNAQSTIAAIQHAADQVWDGGNKLFEQLGVTVDDSADTEERDMSILDQIDTIQVYIRSHVTPLVQSLCDTLHLEQGQPVFSTLENAVGLLGSNVYDNMERLAQGLNVTAEDTSTMEHALNIAIQTVNARATEYRQAITNAQESEAKRLAAGETIKGLEKAIAELNQTNIQLRKRPGPNRHRSESAKRRADPGDRRDPRILQVQTQRAEETAAAAPEPDTMATTTGNAGDGSNQAHANMNNT